MARRIKAVEKLTHCLSKKGKLKGKNKKETKDLRNGCVHHKYTKHDKIKPLTFSNDGQYLICSACGHKFLAKFRDNDEIKAVLDPMIELNDLNKFMAVSVNAGDEVVSNLVAMGVNLGRYKKTSKKLRNIASKQDSIKKKNKSKNRGSNGSSQYGSWGSTK